MSATIAAVAGFQNVAALLFVASPVLYTCLRKLQPKYSTQRYGVYSRDTDEILQAPPQLKRHELRAESDNIARCKPVGLV